MTMYLSLGERPVKIPVITLTASSSVSWPFSKPSERRIHLSFEQLFKTQGLWMISTVSVIPYLVNQVLPCFTSFCIVSELLFCSFRDNIAHCELFFNLYMTMRNNTLFSAKYRSFHVLKRLKVHYFTALKRLKVHYFTAPKRLKGQTRHTILPTICSSETQPIIMVRESMETSRLSPITKVRFSGTW